MTSMARRFFVGTLLVLMSAAVSTPLVSAQTDDWKAMRAEGRLGERYDGFLESRDAAAAAAVDRINEARRKLYQKRAAEVGVSVDQVGRVYFSENLAQLPAGTWIRLENGNWVQK